MVLQELRERLKAKIEDEDEKDHDEPPRKVAKASGKSLNSSNLLPAIIFLFWPSQLDILFYLSVCFLPFLGFYLEGGKRAFVSPPQEMPLINCNQGFMYCTC